MLAAGAGAAERVPSLDLNIEGSLPVQYTDNASRSAEKQSDVLLTPYLRLSATGHLQADLDYTIYASGGHARFGRVLCLAPTRQWRSHEEGRPLVERHVRRQPIGRIAAAFF